MMKKKHEGTQISDVHLFCSDNESKTIPSCGNNFSPIQRCQDPIGNIPMLIHNIIYNSPGNFVTLKHGESSIPRRLRN